MPVQQKDEVTDSDDEPKPEYGNIAIVVMRQKKHTSPRTINAMMVGTTSHDHDRWKRINESVASVERELRSDEVEARE